MMAAMAAACAGAMAQALTFDASSGERRTVVMPRGETVSYTAYEGLYYVTDVEDSTYQFMNVYVPDGADGQTPIFMPNYVGGYMAAAARDIDAGDASGRALSEGYVVAIAGARGRNSRVGDTYTGRAPKGLLDLKAAVRYLRLFDDVMAGNAEMIITNGTSAGGAMSSLLGASGNNPAYADMLRAMGAADERDDVFASVCFCPIVDLDHADMAYEWLFQCTNNVSRPLTDEQLAVSEELAALFPDYVNSLNLRKPDGSPLTADNYMDYIKQLLVESAQAAKDAGADIADTLGLVFSEGKKFAAPVNGGKRPVGATGAGPRELPAMAMPAARGEYVVDIDARAYLNYIVSTIRLKTPPAFDSQGVCSTSRPSGENEEMGDAQGSSVNFTDYSAAKASTTVSDEVKENVRLLNPMRMMDDEGSTVARYWYIRHGARDRDTAFPVPINLATRLENKGMEVSFKLPWDRPHSGDYALDELFGWIKTVTTR